MCLSVFLCLSVSVSLCLSDMIRLIRWHQKEPQRQPKAILLENVPGISIPLLELSLS